MSRSAQCPSEGAKFRGCTLRIARDAGEGPCRFWFSPSRPPDFPDREPKLHFPAPVAPMPADWPKDAARKIRHDLLVLEMREEAFTGRQANHAWRQIDKVPIK